MKKTIVTIAIILLSAYMLYAQPPQGINYQAVAYNSTGQLVTNQAVGVRFSILDGGASGPVVYQETHNPTTDNAGVFALVIGNGTAVSGTFSSINWGNGNKWLRTEIDIAGGNNYVTMGSSAFMSVPYSLYTQKAAFAEKTSFSSGSFTIPDGFNNVATVVIPDSSNYTVPAGKNLYLPTAERSVKIDGNIMSTNLSGGGANARTFVGASENSQVWIFFEPITGFLVDKHVTWSTINLTATPLTVPPGKQFVVVNSMYGTTGNPVNLPGQCTITVNSVATALVSNTVLAEGTVISTINCVSTTGQVDYIVNGYFMDK